MQHALVGTSKGTVSLSTWISVEKTHEKSAIRWYLPFKFREIWAYASCTSIAAAAACWMVWLGDPTVLVLIQIDPFNKAMIIPINVRDGLSIPSPIQVFSILMHLTFGGSIRIRSFHTFFITHIYISNCSMDGILTYIYHKFQPNVGTWILPGCEICAP